MIKLPMTSANEQNAKFNDQIHALIKGEDVVAAELELIKSLVHVPSKILDLGCGTGRHLIPLVELGYDVTGIDESEEMLKVLKNKLKDSKSPNNQITKSPKIIHSNFYDYDFSEKFDLAIMMWNSLNEVCKYKSDLEEFFAKLKNITNKDSKILINIDDLKVINIPEIDHTLETKMDEIFYKSDWKVIAFDVNNNITTSRETISVYDKNKNLLTQTSGEIDQKWWSIEEIESVSKKFGYTLENKSIAPNLELYLVLTQSE